jgi:hypothetical protein
MVANFKEILDTNRELVESEIEFISRNQEDLTSGCLPNNKCDIESLKMYKSISNKLGLKYIDIRCNMIDTHGLYAMCHTSKDQTFYKNLQKEKCILFFQEYDRCTTDIKEKVDNIINTRMFGDLKLGENVLIMY